MTTESAAKMALNSHHCNGSILWQIETVQIPSWLIAYNQDFWRDYVLEIWLAFLVCRNDTIMT